ncbi:glycine betaine/proline transport system permease protein [Breoghania corrubedonensis]|uniref:Glycine betaine/proline transport system permease protein n=1 Tax=Breoghania corrubedonensis TaxID=665038 RepID=A0A2T5V7P9_9HYPH|nr:choline ABC transporter permease subunit [Breoghania corrubedonensis]PTW59785.1 glycine betaine/proline transport system permease protein [Breoghania corrubedonensis]
MNWIAEHKIQIGRWVSQLVDWLTDNAAGVFDTIAWVLSQLIDSLLWVLLTPPPLVVVLITVALAWLVRRNWSFPVFVAIALLFVINQGYWKETMETLSLVISASVICMVAGVPIGILAARSDTFYAILRPILDLMQTIPTFVYLIPALILFGLGMVPGLIATVIFAIPAPIRLTRLGIASTPKPLIEAGQAFGATRWQLLWKIEMPYATPSIMAGLTQTIMLSLSMVVIAALVGADGLGVPTLRALNQVNIAKGFEVGLAIVMIAIMLDRFLKIDDEKAGR